MRAHLEDLGAYAAPAIAKMRQEANVNGRAGAAQRYLTFLEANASHRSDDFPALGGVPGPEALRGGAHRWSMKSGLADQAANRKENKRDGAAVRQRVIANLGRAHELAASGALTSLIRLGRQVEGGPCRSWPSGSADRRQPRPCVLLLPGALDAEASRRSRAPSRTRLRRNDPPQLECLRSAAST